MSVRFGKKTIDALTISNALSIADRNNQQRVRARTVYAQHGVESTTAPASTASGTATPPITMGTICDRFVIMILKRIPHTVRTSEHDARIHRNVKHLQQQYANLVIFNCRLPLELLVHNIAVIAVPDYAPYTKAALKHGVNYARYDIVWNMLQVHVSTGDEIATTTTTTSPPITEVPNGASAVADD